MENVGENKERTVLEKFLVAQSLVIDWKLILDSDTFDALESCCRALECAMETITLPFLTMAAAHMGDCHCKVNADWLEQLTTWCIVIARKGEKKTTVCDKIRAETGFTESADHRNLHTADGSSKETVKIISLNDNNTSESNRHGSHNKKQTGVVIIDNLEYHLTKSMQKLQSLFSLDDPESESVPHFFAMCQALGISDLVSALKNPNMIGQFEHFLICCASDFDFSEVQFGQINSINLYAILLDIRKVHNGSLNEYVLNADGAEEFFRVRKTLHVLKQHYTEDEVRWGCISHTLGHVIRMAAVLLALSNRGNLDDHSMKIGSHFVKRAFLFVLQLLRHKFALIDDAYDSTEFVELLTAKESHNLRASVYHTDNHEEDLSANEDVIEIRLGDHNEPVARILSNGHSVQGDLHGMNESSSSDVHILRQGYAQQTLTNDSHTVPYLQIKDEKNIPTNQREDTGKFSKEIHQSSSSSQPIFPDRHMVAQTRYPNSREKSFDRPPPLLKIRNTHFLQNKSKSLPPKRIIEENRSVVKNDIYTCSDELFIHQCTLKIKKCMLTHGNIITSSYACQYRLFPPVPLVQRTSSPRTTHPSWAAIKFFERLQKLGLGEVLVFRSQSIRFQKKPYDEMTEETRALLRSIGVDEEDYREALGKNNDITLRVRHSGRNYIEYVSKDKDGVYYQMQEMAE